MPHEGTSNPEIPHFTKHSVACPRLIVPKAVLLLLLQLVFWRPLATSSASITATPGSDPQLVPRIALEQHVSHLTINEVSLSSEFAAKHLVFHV